MDEIIEIFFELVIGTIDYFRKKFRRSKKNGKEDKPLSRKAHERRMKEHKERYFSDNK